MSTDQPSTPAERRAANMLAVPAADEVIPLALAQALGSDFDRYLVGSIGDPNRRVDQVEHRVDEDVHFFLGYHEQTVRLFVAVIFDDRDRTAEVALRATKGSRDAVDATDWGAQGPDVGNSLLVARAFHIGLIALRRGGVRTIINTPYDARVRARYIAMGFANGERLDLTSASSLASLSEISPLPRALLAKPW